MILKNAEIFDWILPSKVMWILMIPKMYGYDANSGSYYEPYGWLTQIIMCLLGGYTSNSTGHLTNLCSNCASQKNEPKLLTNVWISRQ